MQRRTAFAVACIAALTTVHCPAQQRPVPLQLVPTGRAFARGDGEVVRCLVRDDSVHMLTVGAECDLVWWNLRERRPLRWIPPPDEPLLALRLHPAEPWVVCQLDGGTWLRVDLANGDVQTLTAEQAEAISAPAGGWLTGGHGSTAEVVSRDGKRRIVMNERARRRQPGVIGQLIALGSACWLANDGTAIEAKHGALRIHGVSGGSADCHAHCGAPQQLSFTPDGGHLALLSAGAVQVVDISGQEIAHFEGTHLVRPGPQPNEFWLLTQHSMQRWSAPQRANVGDAVVWPGRHLRLSDESYDRRRLRHVLVRDSQPWTAEAARLPDGKFRALATVRPLSTRESLSAFANERAIGFDDANGSMEPLLLTSLPGNAKIIGRSTLWQFDAEGGTTHHLALSGEALWLARYIDALNPLFDGRRVWVGMQDGSVHPVDTGSLTVGASAKFDPLLTAAVALNGTHLLATTGQRLLRVDPWTLAVVDEVPLPPRLHGVDLLARSPDGKRLAIAHRSAVWLLDVK